MKHIFFQSKSRYIFSICYIVIITTIYFLTNDPNFENLLVSFANATFISGFTLILIGLLSICSYNGAFDIFSYTFSRKSAENGKRITLYDHQQLKIEKRKHTRYNFIPYTFIGGIVLIISIILNIIYAI